MFRGNLVVSSRTFTLLFVCFFVFRRYSISDCPQRSICGTGPRRPLPEKKERGTKLRHVDTVPVRHRERIGFDLSLPQKLHRLRADTARAGGRSISRTQPTRQPNKGDARVILRLKHQTCANKQNKKGEAMADYTDPRGTHVDRSPT